MLAGVARGMHFAVRRRRILPLGCTAVRMRLGVLVRADFVDAGRCHVGGTRSLPDAVWGGAARCHAVGPALAAVVERGCSACRGESRAGAAVIAATVIRDQ